MWLLWGLKTIQTEQELIPSCLYSLSSESVQGIPLEGDLAARGVRKSGCPVRSPLRGVNSSEGYSLEAEGGAMSDIVRSLYSYEDSDLLAYGWSYKLLLRGNAIQLQTF